MPCPRRPLLRIVLAVSLDGRLAPPGGGPAQLGGKGDRRVLEEALAWADACLIGAQTLRQHGTTCLIHDSGLLQERRRKGRTPQPIAIAVSRSGHFPAAMPFFRQPLQRWLFLADAAAATPPPSPPFGFHRCDALTTWPEALGWLMDQRIERIAVLGGATLIASLLEERLVDELQLTLVPRLLGGPHLWVPCGALWDGTGSGDSWCLVEHRPLGDGEEILVRYRKLAGAGQGAA